MNTWYEDLAGTWSLYGSDRKYTNEEREALVNLFPELEGGLVIRFEGPPYTRTKEIFKTHPNDLEHGNY